MNIKFAAALMCLLAFSTGCSSLSPLGKGPVPGGNGGDVGAVDAAPPVGSANGSGGSGTRDNQPPAIGNGAGATRMAIIWNEKILTIASNSAVRGFTGRIYFYNSRDELITVDGELTVYAYDDSKEHGSNVPDAKYVFRADEFRTKFSPSELGPAYSVWIPWESRDSFRKSIALVPVFKAGADIIPGGIHHVMLSGKTPIDASIERQTIGNFSDTRMSVTDAQRRTREIDSIRVPQSIANRMTDAEVRRFSPEANRALDAAFPATANRQAELLNQIAIPNPNPNQSPINSSPVLPQGQNTVNFNDSPGNRQPPQQTPTVQNSNPATRGLAPFRSFLAPLAQPTGQGATTQEAPARVHGRPGPIR